MTEEGCRGSSESLSSCHRQGEPSVDTRVEKLVEKKSIWTVAALKDLSQLLGLEKSGDRVGKTPRFVRVAG